jgi:hypothetical protein
MEEYTDQYKKIIFDLDVKIPEMAILAASALLVFVTSLDNHNILTLLSLFSFSIALVLSFGSLVSLKKGATKAYNDIFEAYRSVTAVEEELRSRNERNPQVIMNELKQATKDHDINEIAKIRRKLERNQRWTIYFMMLGLALLIISVFSDQYMPFLLEILAGFVTEKVS